MLGSHVVLLFSCVIGPGICSYLYTYACFHYSLSFTVPSKYLKLEGLCLSIRWIYIQYYMKLYFTPVAKKDTISLMSNCDVEVRS
jgi:hypothetical protein